MYKQMRDTLNRVPHITLNCFAVLKQQRGRAPTLDELYAEVIDTVKGSIAAYAQPVPPKKQTNLKITVYGELFAVTYLCQSKSSAVRILQDVWVKRDDARKVIELAELDGSHSIWCGQHGERRAHVVDLNRCH